MKIGGYAWYLEREGKEEDVYQRGVVITSD